jgi:hypothetical protein
VAGLDVGRARTIKLLEGAITPFVSLLAEHRPQALRGQSLREAVSIPSRTPRRLAALYEQWLAYPHLMWTAAPTLVFAVFGKARANGKLSPEQEDRLLGTLITGWALLSTPGSGTALSGSSNPAAPRRPQRTAPELVPTTRGGHRANLHHAS